MSEKGDENTEVWRKSTEPASFLQMNFSQKKKKSLDKLGGKYLSDENFLTPLSTENLFHEVWLRASLTATKTTQIRDKQKWKKLGFG